MKIKKIIVLFCGCVVLLITNVFAQQTVQMKEQYRPQIHFSPQKNWMNDPNGMVYLNGVYNLFFQYNPYSSVWGPMHWGHATSKDLIHWQRQPIAIYPDSLGTIFSGSAVLDKNNTSGLGKKGQAPLVAIFTQHDTVGEKAGKNDFQNQSIAYSVDEGKTWIKYSGNPVLKNPGLRDFRDPKVMWFEPQKKWIMTLAANNIVIFYSSPDLKNWTRESEFGKDYGAHGGGWECPDLIALDGKGTPRWVLIVNLNPGAPNGGSGTQYFVGNFDGTTFTSDQKETKWLDYGPDNYAGVTWSNTGKRKILIGWMTNWQYANLVPTEKWRSAMTIPRELKLKHVDNDIFIVSQPVTELAEIERKRVTITNLAAKGKVDLSKQIGEIKFPCRINIKVAALKDFSLLFSNNAGDKLILGYDKKENQYFIDRSISGKTAFQKDFAAKHTAHRIAKSPQMNMSLVIDVSSIELFADDGLTEMTEIFFPNKPYNQLHLLSDENMLIKKLEYCRLKSIW